MDNVVCARMGKAAAEPEKWIGMMAMSVIWAANEPLEHGMKLYTDRVYPSMRQSVERTH